MNKRVRAAVLSAVAALTAGLLNVTTAAPANAADGDTCMDPVVTGTIKKVSMTDPNGFTLNATEFNQTGFTSANCPTTFTEYRYKIMYTYDGRTVTAYNTDLQPSYTLTPSGLVRNGTRIIFPTLRMAYGGHKDVSLRVTSGSKSVFSNVWCRSNEEAYDSVIKKEQWADYDTVVGVPRSRINACP